MAQDHSHVRSCWVFCLVRLAQHGTCTAIGRLSRLVAAGELPSITLGRNRASGPSWHGTLGLWDILDRKDIGSHNTSIPIAAIFFSLYHHSLFLVWAGYLVFFWCLDGEAGGAKHTQERGVIGIS